MNLKFFALLLAATGGLLQSQSQVPRPTFDAFEVATIKPTPPDWHGGAIVRMQSAHRFEVKNYTLKSLIGSAYNLTSRAISGGQAWITQDHFDIVAVAPGDVRPTRNEQMSMLQRLLTDRFKLTFHREQKEFSIYSLNVAKSGFKLKESTVSPEASPEGPPPLVFALSPGNVRLSGQNATIAELASILQQGAVDRPVIDNTGLSARYDFVLEFTPDESQFGGRVPPGPSDSPKPDFFSAIQQQLGLRLKATKGPINTFVIDSAEKPSEN